MPENIKDQILLNNVKKFIKYYLEYLQKEGFTQFQEKPTVEVFPKRKNLVGLALIDEKNRDLNCFFIDNPHQADDYSFWGTIVSGAALVSGGHYSGPRVWKNKNNPDITLGEYLELEQNDSQ